MNRVQAEAAKKATLHLIANHKYYIDTEEKKLDQYQLIIDAPVSVDLKHNRRKGDL